MTQAVFSVTMDKDLMDRFESSCEAFGTSMTAAINVFARAVVREGAIPPDLSLESVYRSDAIENFQGMREIGVSASEKELSLEEINAEIDAARN